jgi:hypothetical protein
MNRDDVIRMARETGLDLYINDVTEEPYAIRLERFAALVAEHEREECAKLCDYRVGIWIIPAGPAECAAAIRRRGEK